MLARACFAVSSMHLVPAAPKLITPRPMPIGRRNDVVSAQLKAVADRNACCGYGVCSEICPQVFQRDDDGHVVVAMEIVPAELAERAKEAAAGCPQNALEIVEV